MKKIVLLFAAAVALASCVKENTFEQTQPADGLVTIKALAMDTKTTLDGTDVLWEDGDAIKVIFNSADDRYEKVFTTTLTEKSSVAEFPGELDPEVTVETYGTTGYAIYPSSVELDEDGKIKFSVAANQTGTVKAGQNLSYAKVSLADMLDKQTTNARFYNALSLMKINVPAGIKSVTVETTELDPEGYPETALAGKAPFIFGDNDKLEIAYDKWSNTEYVLEPNEDEDPNVDGDELMGVTYVLKEKSIVLKNETNSALAAGDYNVLVFPGEHAGLKITVEGTDCSYEKTIGAFTFVAGQYHTLNVANIFSIEETTFSASPFGGTVEIPVTTTLDASSYELEIEQEGNWLSDTPPVKGAFRKDVVSLYAAENGTGVTRSATVTFKNGDEVLNTVTVTQNGYVAALLGKYAESYLTGGSPCTAGVGFFEIKITDAPDQGDYLVEGILGGDVYADYENGVLTCYYGNNRKQTFNVSDEYQITATEGIIMGVTIYPASMGGKYNAVKAEEPTYTSDEEALLGEYDEIFHYSPDGEDDGGNLRMTSSSKGMKIEKSEDVSFGKFKIKCLTYGGSYNAYADYEDGKLTVSVDNRQHSKFNSNSQKLNPIVFDVTKDGDTYRLSFDSWTCMSGYNPATVQDYVATPHSDAPETPGDDNDDEDPIAGTWTLTAGEMGTSTGGPYSSIITEKMVISGSNGSYVIEKIADVTYNMSVTLDGNTLSSEPAYTGGPVFTLTYDSQNNTLTQGVEFCNFTSPALKGIVATKPGEAVEIDITGTYGETGKSGSDSYLSLPFSGTFNIALNNDAKGTYLISGMFDIYTCGMGGTYYADFADGILTIKSANSSHSTGAGSLPSDIIMTYSDGVFTMTEATCIGNAYVGEYTATKQ